MAKRAAANETRLVTQFFSPASGIKAENEMATKTTSVIKIDPILSQKLVDQAKAFSATFNMLLDGIDKRDNEKENGGSNNSDDDNSQFVQLDKETSDQVKSLIQESEKIQRIRKERIFEDDVTEAEMDIIKRRVELQRRQYAEFERREFAHKANKIRQMFDYLHDDEIREALKQNNNNEEEVIYQFSAPGYLLKVRKEIAIRHTPTTQAPQMTDTQRKEYEELLKKRNRTQRKTTTEDQKNMYRTVGRLPLDEALAQLHRHTSNAKTMGDVNLAKAMKGWSEARIKAFKAIKTKPNTYYYRFNAPGEEQRTGQWTPEEQKLFHQRLREIGANGQWGIFSMTIPGRVGYQCSNYYRYLIESKQLHDPNYVLDEKGRAHYLFTTKKKNPDGTAVKAFRKHKKPHVRMSRERYKYSDDEDDASNTDGNSTAVLNSDPPSSGLADSVVAASAINVSAITNGGSTGKRATTARATNSRKRKRRVAYNPDSDGSSDEIKASEVQLSDDDYEQETSDGEFNGRRTATTTGGAAKKQRRRGAAAMSESGNSSATDAYGHSEGASLSTRAASSTAHGTDHGRRYNNTNNDDDDDDEEEDDDNSYDPYNPLPDLLDPITLEPVRKPAISPYGHVMGYDSWIRCLMFPPEGSQRNICPLTKKPLTKRDLVVLTLENIEEYRSKIVNM
ncbi:hypothetical protein H4219_004201 [Mycoemilia scoparia]|uniref:Myb-like domain-containing protein n=1 Tax=Mycoemilia scoparia TaxID=417184 RepID=A0A9W7ZSG1_9FUNG|nr:hypothetical protein H4219_004201 [Mycoemilia scoparia]